MFVDSLSRSDLHQKDIRKKLPPQLWPLLSTYCPKIWYFKVSQFKIRLQFQNCFFTRRIIIILKQKNNLL